MLIADKLSYQIGSNVLLQEVSLQLNQGELLVVLGANGAGKSTLFNMLSGDRMPTKGSVFLHGKELHLYGSEELATKRAVINQQNTMNMAFTALEIVLMGRYPHYGKSSAKKDLEIAELIMELTGITHLAHRSYLSLSGGEQQRVQLSRALSQIWEVENPVLLMDEPVSNLDLLHQQQTLAIAKQFAKNGAMVIAILHDINLASQYADRIIMLKNGLKYYDGLPSDVLSAPNIEDVFNIKADIFINPLTQKSFFIPQDASVKLNQN